MEDKVIYEVRLSKPVMVLATVAAIGLLAIGAKPLIEATPAFAQSNQVHKIAICNETASMCADVTKSNFGGKQRFNVTN